MGDLGYVHEIRRKVLAMVEPLRVNPPRSASQNAADLAIELLGR
jgi:hypothetical protein